MNDPVLSIIIVSYNVRQLLLNCIKSILAHTTGILYEIIVVDNASSDGTIEAVKKCFPKVQIIANRENVGFASANNQGYAISKGEFLLLLNPDTLIKPGAIKSVLEFMIKTPDAGIAGCRLLNPDGTLQKSIRRFPSVREHIARAFFLDRVILSEYRTNIFYRKRPFKIDYCTGAFMMVRRESLGDLPLLNSEFFMYAEEKDLAMRLKKSGWKTYFVPFGEIVHFGEQSTRQMATEMFLELQKSQVIFFRKHYSIVYAWALALTWWLVLISNYIVSLPLSLSVKGRLRLSLFAKAVTRYPVMLKILK